MNTVRVIIKEQVALSVHVNIDRLPKSIIIISRHQLLFMMSVIPECPSSGQETVFPFFSSIFPSLKEDRIWMNLSFSFCLFSWMIRWKEWKKNRNKRRNTCIEFIHAQHQWRERNWERGCSCRCCFYEVFFLLSLFLLFSFNRLFFENRSCPSASLFLLFSFSRFPVVLYPNPPLLFSMKYIETDRKTAAVSLFDFCCLLLLFFFVIETVVFSSCSPRRTRNLSPYFSSLLPIQRKNQYEKHEERKEQEEPDPELYKEPLMILMRLVSLSLSWFSVESLGSEREQEHKLISLSLLSLPSRDNQIKRVNRNERRSTTCHKKQGKEREWEGETKEERGRCWWIKERERERKETEQEHISSQ